MNISGNAPVTLSTYVEQAASRAEAADRQRTVTAMRGLSNSNVFGMNRELTFTIDRTTRRMVIQVIDRETHETVMQLPPESILKMWADMQKSP